MAPDPQNPPDADEPEEHVTPQDLDAVPTEEEPTSEDIERANDSMSHFVNADTSIPHQPGLPEMTQGYGGLTARPGDVANNPVEEAAEEASRGEAESSDSEAGSESESDDDQRDQ